MGVQELAAADFTSRRSVDSGSWLTAEVQGRGLGTEMRSGLLLFAFDQLGAEWAESRSMAWNAASLTVSRKLGYLRVGVAEVEPRPGERVEEVRLRLREDDFVRPRWTPDVTCPDGVLAQLGR